jgi:hypothetical protein
MMIKEFKHKVEPTALDLFRKQIVHNADVIAFRLLLEMLKDNFNIRFSIEYNNSENIYNSIVLLKDDKLIDKRPLN